MAAFWSNASKASAPKKPGGAPTAKSTSSSANLVDFGGIIFKFWMHISKEEQLERFKERERINYKSWKITDEDWRNRAKWEDYQEAARDMVLKTSTPNAPWTLVEANDKLYSRIKVLRNCCRETAP
jgi:AMP-polyphosphate phosphotransferase